MILKNLKKSKHERLDITIHLSVAFFAIFLLSLPSVSTAGGLYLNEFGTPSLGVAGAGANAVASDASTSFHNAAGMTRIKGKELMGTGGLLNATVKFDPDADTPIPNGNGEVKIDGDDVAFGFGLGALFEVSERTRFGVVYQSEIEPEFDGAVKVSGPGIEAGTDTKITMARFVTVSGYHELNDRWALLGTVGWEDWSAFKDVNISTDRGSQKIPRNWKDTWKFAAGVHFRPVDKWLLRLGVSYDTSPVDSDDRTPDMPIDRQIRYATGVQYQWSERLNVGGSFVYADYGDAKIKNDLLRGDYERNDIFFFAMNASWKF